MSYASRSEYLEAIRKRYLESSKKDKKVILDEFCQVCGYNRKYSIQRLNKEPQENSNQRRFKRGRKRKYDKEVFEIIKHLWITTNLPCSKRLKVIIPLWLPYYPYSLEEGIKEALLTISPATIDRMMKPWRSRYLKQGLATTKPGSLLKKHIPIKTNQWDECKPGFLEVDSVAHCGNSVSGMFVYTINSVDIFSGWTEQRAVWGKGERGVIEAIKSIENALVFDIHGFDCDNGSEFINWHLLRYLKSRKKPVNFTRTRPYYKNDNAHIEGKNWTHVRQYLGYQRFDKIELVDLLNDLYTSEWNRYFNFFIPSVKLLSKERIGSKTLKKHDLPKTPYQRILAAKTISLSTKEKLENQFEQLNPFQLQKRMFEKIKNIMQIVNEHQNEQIVDNLQLSTVIESY